MSSATNSSTAMIKYVQIIYYRFRYLLLVMSLSDHSTVSGTNGLQPLEPSTPHAHRAAAKAAAPCAFSYPRFLSLSKGYSYWFLCLYLSPNSWSSLNLSILSGFRSPAFSNFCWCFHQFLIPLSSSTNFDGRLLLASIKSMTVCHCCSHRSS